MKNFTDKSEARKYFLAFRKNMSENRRADAARALCEQISALPCFEQAHTLLLYCPTRGELDLMPLAEHFWQSGRTVAFPISHTDSTTLSFHTVGSYEELSVGAYGIYEPPSSSPCPGLDGGTLCIVPALAYDRRGYRLGYGKGYYDRFLAEFKVSTVGAVPSEFLCCRLPIDSNDIAVDILITEAGVVSK